MDKKTILLAEDEKPLADGIKQKLEKVGYKVLYAADGEACLEIAFESKPDLILLDIEMPFINGLEVLARLRKDNWGKEVPVILLTVYSDIDKVAEAVEHKTLDYFVKSQISIDDVIKKIKEYIG